MSERVERAVLSDGVSMRAILAASVRCFAPGLINLGRKDRWPADNFTCLQSRGPAINPANTVQTIATAGEWVAYRKGSMMRGSLDEDAQAAGCLRAKQMGWPV